jgi:KaiC/GvpD/RAD55 family RecA-like ATPase
MTRVSNVGGKRRDAASTEALPPHAEEAERGVLGCVLLDYDGSRGALDKVAVQVKAAEWFYVLAHRLIFSALMGMRAEGVRPDTITLVQRLKDTGRLSDAGGVGFVTTLPEQAVSVEQLDYYLRIVREKFVLRSVLTLCTRTAGSLGEFEGALEERLNGLAVSVAELQLVHQDPDAGPKRVVRPAELGEAYHAAWFGGADGTEPGKHLPVTAFRKFPFKFRPCEVTFLLGEKGNGKSTLLSEILLHLAAQGERVIIASMETPGGVSLKILAAQLLGESRLPDNEWGHAQSRAALAWLNERVFIYDFLGIADWRNMLPDFRYAAQEFGATVASIDSIMRLGIPDDDFAQQGQAAIAFANLANEEEMHVVLVNHLNKSDRNTKSRSRGSQQWIDNSHNVISVERNEKKHDEVGALRGLVDTGAIDGSEFQERLKDLEREWSAKGKWWDANFVLHNQRWPGSQQNGARRLFYTKKGLQYADKPAQEGTRWLDAWKGTSVPATGRQEEEAPVQTSAPVQSRLQVDEEDLKWAAGQEGENRE